MLNYDYKIAIVILMADMDRRQGWTVKGIRISDGYETQPQDIPASEIFSAIKIWSECRPGNYTILTYGEVKLN